MPAVRTRLRVVVSDAGSAVFVGRSAELSVLRTLMAGVATGRGGAVWVEGEPGIGKSALVREGLAGAAEAGCAVFFGAGDRSRQGFPLGVMLDCLEVDGRASDPARAQIMRVLRGEGTAGVVPTGNPAVAAAELVCELVDRLCAVSPVVIVIDDIHWADEVSVSTWNRLAGGTGSVPLLVVGVACPVPRSTAVADARRGVRAQGGVMVELGRLGDEEVAAMLGGLLGAVPGPKLLTLAGHAGGNPLFVRELTDALVREDRVRVAHGVAEVADGSGPGKLVSLTAAIEDRLDLLPNRAVECLRWAALLGERFSVGDVAVVQRCAVRDLVGVVRESVEAGVLTESGDELVFRHGMIRHALVDVMPASLRLGLHREAARSLAEAGAPVEKVAAQLAAASVGTGGESSAGGLPPGPQAPDRWVMEWLQANASVLVYRAPKIAAGLLEQAASAAAVGDPGREVLAEALAGALLLLGRHEQAEKVARRLLAASGNPERRAQMAWTIAYALLYISISGISQALDVVDQALNDPATSQTWVARLGSIRALLVTSYGGDRTAATAADEAVGDVAAKEAAMAVAEAALADAERAGDRFAAGYALHALSLIHGFAGDDLAFLDTIERALTVIGNDPETADLRLLLMTNRLTSLSRLGRDIDADARELLALAERVGTARTGTVRLAFCQYLFDVGRWDDALAELGPLFEPGANIAELDMLACRGLAAMIAVCRDDQAGLDRHMVAAGRLPDLLGNNIYIADLTRVRALAAERAGRPADAAGILASAADPDFAMDLEQRVRWLSDLVRCALAAGDLRTARAAAHRCEEETRGLQVAPRVIAAARQCRGLVDSTPEPLVEAVTNCRAMAHPLDLAHALEDLAVVQGSRGALALGRAALREAVDIYTSLGADWDVIRADARTRPYGVRRRRQGNRRPDTGWEALTPTETKIAYLVAEGLSNPDIGARLLISWRTARFHVSSIMAKLGVHSRIEVAREAARHPQIATMRAAHAAPHRAKRPVD